MALTDRLTSKPVLFALAAVLIVAVGGGAWWMLRPTPYQQGLRLEGLGEYEGAVAKYQLHLQKEPAHRDSLYRLAWILSEKLPNRAAEAMQYADQVLAQDPQDIEAALVGGRARLSLSERAAPGDSKNTLLTQAGQMFDKVLSAQPENPTALMGAARVDVDLWSGGQLDALPKAQEHLKRLIQAKPDDVDGHLLLAQTYVSTGQYAEAKPLAERAVQLAAQNDYAYYLLAWTQLYTESPQKALESANTAVQLPGGAARARNHHVLGVVYLALDPPNLQQAENELKRAYDLDRGDPTYVRDYVRLPRPLERLEESRDLITQVMQQGGADPRLLMTLYSIQYRLGNREAANGILAQYTERFPNSPEALLELASSLYEQRQYGEAGATYQKVLSIDPNNAIANFNLGTIDLSQLNYADAETLLQKSAFLRPDFAKAHLNLGNVYFITNRLDEARAEYEKVRQLEPDNAIVLNNLGLVERRTYQQGGDAAALGRAQDFFQQAYEKDPSFLEPMLNQALLLSRQGQFDTALGLLDKAKLLFPTEPVLAVMTRGYIHLEQGSYTAAEEEYRQVIRDSQVQSDKNLAQNGLAVALYKEGKYDQALAELDAVIAQQGERTRPLAMSNRGMVMLTRDGAMPEVRTLLSEAIQLEDLGEAHANLARLELLSGNLSEAVAECKKALEKNEQLRGVHYNQALALERQEQWKEAEAAYREELRVNPEFLEASLNLGLNLLSQARLDDALAVLSAAQSKNPNHPRLLVALAMVQLAKEQFAEATTLAKRAADLDANLGPAQSVLAVVAARENRLREAERYALRARELAPGAFYPALNLAAIYALENKFTDARLALDKTPDPGTDSLRRQRLYNTKIAILVNMGLLERAREMIPLSLALADQQNLKSLGSQIDAVVTRE